MSRDHIIGAKVVVALLLGALLGYAIGSSLKRDAERGKALTMKQYVADFDRHKAKLETSEMPMALSLVSGVIMVAGLFGVYELLAFGLGKALAAVTGGGGDSVSRPTQSAWRSGDQ